MRLDFPAICRICFIVFFLPLVWTAEASASDIRIHDSKGLTRFSGIAKTPLTLQVTIAKSGAAESVRLQPEDSFKKPLHGQKKDPIRFLFASVAPGRYRLVTEPEGVTVSAVEVAPR